MLTRYGMVEVGVYVDVLNYIFDTSIVIGVICLSCDLTNTNILGIRMGPYRYHRGS